MSCVYVGNNFFTKVGIGFLCAKEKSMHPERFDNKFLYFVDTGYFKTLYELTIQIMRIRKINRKACVVLIDNNLFIPAIHGVCYLEVDKPLKKWKQVIHAVISNVSETIKACLNAFNLNKLTEVQRRIFYHLQCGMPVLNISKKLLVTAKTVYAHRKVIAELLGFSSSIYLTVFLKNEFKYKHAWNNKMKITSEEVNFTFALQQLK